MQLTDNKFIFPRHNLLSDYTNCPEQLIRFILKTSSPLSKIILIFPESEKYFLCYSTFIYLFFFCHHSNYPMSSINHPKNRGQKTVFFCSFFCSKIVLKPLYVVVEPYSFSPEPQYVIRIILSTCLE